jgi:hypothetical protein
LSEVVEGWLVWDREVKKKKEKVKGKRVILRNLTQGLIYTMRALP